MSNTNRRVAQLGSATGLGPVGRRFESSRRPHSKSLLLKQVFRLSFMRMSTSAGGSSLAKRDNVASATARRARIKDGRNPLSPTTLKETDASRFLRLSFMKASSSQHDEGNIDKPVQHRTGFCLGSIWCRPANVLVFSDNTILRCRQVETNNSLILKDKSSFDLSSRFEATT